LLRGNLPPQTNLQQSLGVCRPKLAVKHAEP
jgi:hypothetical protein